ncbi:MAG: GNAT family N-acetyltransferase [Alphaproteobacteria bacterium]|nr:GNAT family N-acetyltransferase [Alphaproteobacteria bacterium]
MIRGLRPATVADAVPVAALVDRAYGHYVARIGQKPYPMIVDYAEAIAAMQGHVVEEAGRIVGLLLLEPEEEWMMVENVAVDPSLQGRGLGRALMELAEAEARRQRLFEMRLYTHQMMLENQEIYERLGYVAYDRQTVHGRPRVYMRKPLRRTP